MRKASLIIFGALLVAGVTAQMAVASDYQGRKAYRPAAAAGQFSNAYDSSIDNAKASCQGREAGNPYNEQTDYQSWSAFRVSGAWDSRNDCW